MHAYTRTPETPDNGQRLIFSGQVTLFVGGRGETIVSSWFFLLFFFNFPFWRYADAGFVSGRTSGRMDGIPNTFEESFAGGSNRNASERAQIFGVAPFPTPNDNNDFTL